MLEIGISHGYSVVSFCRTYPKSIIYGVDINLDIWNKNKKSFKLTQDEKKRLNIIKHDATDKNICNKVPNDLDVILDDGSHKPDDIIKTFELLFKNNLKKGGIYIVEDIHCNNYPFPFLEYVKQLFPFTYKFKDFKECRMLSGKKNIENRIKLDWKFQIKDITISRDIIIITKE
jgi:predicted O-methyltransferase YrrM